MEESNRWPKVIFAILVVVLLAEFAYFLLYSKRTETTSSSPSQVVTPEPKKIPTFDSGDPKQAINPKVLMNLSNLKKDILITSELTNHYNGQATEIGREDGGLVLKLRGGKDSVNTIYYSAKEVEIMTFKKINFGGEPLKAAIDDLKPGQTIMIEEHWDLFQDLTNILTEVTITYIPIQ